MRLRISHRTTYRYDQPIAYAIQSLRLIPRDFDGQVVKQWALTVSGRRRPLPAYIDGFGNWVSLHTRNEQHDQNEIIVTGVVDVFDRSGVVSGADEPLPPLSYLRETALTQLDNAIVEFANTISGEVDLVKRLHELTAGIAERVAYRTGESDARTTAIQAFHSGVGVCQDHAHVMIACARALGLPARYVSGYLHADEGGGVYDASHAWAEVFVPDLGWVGYDPSNGVSPTDSYVRVAVGLDYWSAAPIRGLWRGMAEESLSVAVQVSEAQSVQ